MWPPKPSLPEHRPFHPSLQHLQLRKMSTVAAPKRDRGWKFEPKLSFGSTHAAVPAAAIRRIRKQTFQNSSPFSRRSRKLPKTSIGATFPETRQNRPFSSAARKLSFLRFQGRHRTTTGKLGHPGTAPPSLRAKKEREASGYIVVQHETSPIAETGLIMHEKPKAKFNVLHALRQVREGLADSHSKHAAR